MILWKWFKSCVYYVIIFCLLLAMIGVSYQLIREHLDNRKFPPPGELVDMGDYQLHYKLMGEGTPTVILDAGVGGSSIDWSLVQPKIAQFTSVLSYDRPGYGWSGEISGQRTAWAVVDDLNTFLERKQIAPPYVLVGHSLGAAFMRLYASEHPEKVAGLVLIDPPHEDLEAESSEPPEEIYMPDPQAIVMMSQMGVQRILLEWTDSAPKKFPEEVKKMWLAKQTTVKQTRTALREAEQVDGILKELTPIESHIGNRPLVVISAGKRTDLTILGISDEWDDYAEERFNKQKELHEKMASSASKGRLLIAEDSDHMIPWNEPQIIVDAVKQVVEETRANSTDY